MAENKAQNEDYNQFAPPPPPSNTDYRHARWPRFSDTPLNGSASKPRHSQVQSVRRKPTEVLVVGVCSAGKSTLVRKLKEAGYDARTCAQEHSYVPHLWQLSNPGSLVYLDASLATIRRRRHTAWGQAMVDEQHRRLSHAREHCDLYLETDNVKADEIAETVIRHLQEKANRSSGLRSPEK